MDEAEALRFAQEYRKMMYARGANNPDWKPLLRVVPEKWCPAFQFMGYEGDIRIYKHGWTRRDLNLDPDGNAYAFLDATRSWLKIPVEAAIEDVFAGLDDIGVSREDPYDDAAREKKRNALADAGWTVINLDISKGGSISVTRPRRERRARRRER
jgi:hypothetical protein